MALWCGNGRDRRDSRWLQRKIDHQQERMCRLQWHIEDLTTYATIPTRRTATDNVNDFSTSDHKQKVLFFKSVHSNTGHAIEKLVSHSDRSALHKMKRFNEYRTCWVHTNQFHTFHKVVYRFCREHNWQFKAFSNSFQKNSKVSVNINKKKSCIPTLTQ